MEEPREPFPSLARELRQGVGADLRADAEQTERLVAHATRRKRGLVDVARDARARGDTLIAEVPGRTLTGTVTHAAGDLARLRTPVGDVDLNLRAVLRLRVAHHAARGGVAAGEGPSSFKARLLELELAGAVVELGNTVGDTSLGRLTVVATDHVVLEDAVGTEIHLPLSGVTFVVRR